MPKLIAIGKFYYAGRNVEAGEEFEAEAQDVALLTDAISPRARRSESATTQAPLLETRSLLADDPQGSHQTSTRRYQRRDMRAKV